MRYTLRDLKRDKRFTKEEKASIMFSNFDYFFNSKLIANILYAVIVANVIIEVLEKVK